MLFPTITFAVFFLLVFIGNWLLMPLSLIHISEPTRPY